MFTIPEEENPESIIINAKFDRTGAKKEKLTDLNREELIDLAAHLIDFGLRARQHAESVKDTLDDMLGEGL